MEEKIIELYRVYLLNLRELDTALAHVAECHLVDLYENEDDIDSVELTSRSDRDRAGAVRVMMRALGTAVASQDRKQINAAMAGLNIAMRYLGCPGDWGHHTNIGKGIKKAIDASAELRQELEKLEEAISTERMKRMAKAKTFERNMNELMKAGKSPEEAEAITREKMGGGDDLPTTDEVMKEFIF